MLRYSTNRFRISSAFPQLKLLMGVSIFCFSISLIRAIYNNDITVTLIWELIAETAVAAGSFYFIKTRKQIDYDDIKQVLYVVDVRRQVEFEVPIEKVDQIINTPGGRWGKGSYLFVYRDINNQPDQFRLFPILYDRSIDTIIIDARLKNPGVEIRDSNF